MSRTTPPDPPQDVASIPFPAAQPMPAYATAVPIFDDGAWRRTAIDRQWVTRADIARCMLCRPGKCVAQRLACHMVVDMVVQPKEAYLLKDDGTQWDGPVEITPDPEQEAEGSPRSAGGHAGGSR